MRIVAVAEGRTACVDVTTWECERQLPVLTFEPGTRDVVLEVIPPQR